MPVSFTLCLFRRDYPDTALQSRPAYPDFSLFGDPSETSKVVMGRSGGSGVPTNQRSGVPGNCALYVASDIR